MSRSDETQKARETGPLGDRTTLGPSLTVLRCSVNLTRVFPLDVPVKSPEVPCAAPALIALMVSAPLAAGLVGPTTGRRRRAQQAALRSSPLRAQRLGLGARPRRHGRGDLVEPARPDGGGRVRGLRPGQVRELRTRDHGVHRRGARRRPRSGARPSSGRRVSWERIEPIAGLVEEIDGTVDARVDDFESETDPDCTGWHRLEYLLFEQNTTDGAAEFADGLDPTSGRSSGAAGPRDHATRDGAGRVELSRRCRRARSPAKRTATRTPTSTTSGRTSTARRK